MPWRVFRVCFYDHLSSHILESVENGGLYKNKRATRATRHTLNRGALQSLPPALLHHTLPHARNFAAFSFYGRGEGPIGTCRKMRCEPFACAGGELRVFVMPRNRHMTDRDIMPPSSSPSSSLPWPRPMPDRQDLPELPALLSSSFPAIACRQSCPPLPPAF